MLCNCCCCGGISGALFISIILSWGDGYIMYVWICCLEIRLRTHQFPCCCFLLRSIWPPYNWSFYNSDDLLSCRIYFQHTCLQFSNELKEHYNWFRCLLKVKLNCRKPDLWEEDWAKRFRLHSIWDRNWALA